MQPWKVLIADDERVIVDGLKVLYAWEANGFEIAGTASDGQQALERAAQLHPEIVLMDINMPKMNGIQAIEKMKRILPLAYIIIISGYDDFAYAQQGLRLQVHDYLLKPVSAETLGAVLLRVRRGLEERCGQPCGIRTIDQILRYIDENLDRNLSLNDLAQRFHMTPGYISQYFKKKTHMTFLAYCNRRKVEKACELLRDSDKSITEIAGELGFASYRTFSQVFKRQTGVLPSHYNR